MSASVQYFRQLSAIVATSSGKAIDFADFRCVFTIRRGDFQTPNSADLRIFNLAPQTQNKIAGSEYTTLSISAGYPGNFGLIFQGTIKQFRKGRIDGKDSYVDITAADGDEAYQFATIFQSVPAGSKPSAIADALLKSFQEKGFNQQISAGYQPNFPENGCIRGQVFYGMARNAARDFAKDQNCKWSIQDGKLTFIPFTSYIPTAGQVPVVSPTSGLLGVPEQTPQGLRMRVLLNPTMKIGRCIQLQDTTINQLRFGLSVDKGTQLGNRNANARLNTSNPSGLYYVMAADHHGDSRGHGDDWFTEMTCLAVDAEIPTAEALNALTAVGADAIPRYPGS
jgi:hypothetical protein